MLEVLRTLTLTMAFAAGMLLNVCVGLARRIKLCNCLRRLDLEMFHYADEVRMRKIY